MTLSALEREVAASARRRDAELARTPGLRGQLGAVHTPPELAAWLVRHLDRRVRERGDVASLFDPRVALVDPACGPGAFLAAALARKARLAPHVTQRWLGLELDPEARQQALTQLVGQAADVRVQLAVESVDTLGVDPAPIAGLADVVVVFGNPPWRAAGRAATSRQSGRWLEDFRRDAGGRLDERKLGVLSDLYVQFWRWAAEVVRSSRRGGVVAFLSNASFLDGPVHRGMRGALMRWFDSIDVVDFGGNALLARAPSQDDNLFDVRIGTCAVIAVRSAPDVEQGSPRAHVRYARLRGDRARKLARLCEDDLSLESLCPEEPQVLWVARPATPPGYLQGVGLHEAFRFQREGVQTNRDALLIARTRVELHQRLQAFEAGDEAQLPAQVWRAKPHYDPQRARQAVAEALRHWDNPERLAVRPLAYRPFDTRWVATIPGACHRPRTQLSAAMDRHALALVSVRKDRGAQVWRHVAAVADTVDACFLSTRSSCRTRAFPAQSPDGADNLAPAVRSSWSDHMGCAVDADSFIAYALAVLSAPSFQRRFDAALRADYPRLPMPTSAGEFQALVELGQRMIKLFRWQPERDLAAGGDAEGVPTHGEIHHDAMAGGLCDASGERVAELSRAAFALCIGHWPVVAAYLQARRELPLGMAARAALVDLCRRVEALAAGSKVLDEWVEPLLNRLARS